MDTYRNLLAKVNTNVQNQMTLSYESTSEYNIFIVNDINKLILKL